MIRRLSCLGIFVLLLGSACSGGAQDSYLGFDRNTYPGDGALPALSKTFRYTSYWLNNPPGARSNTWVGKRGILRRSGFGFLVLFNGRLEAAMGSHAAALGTADGKATAVAAAREGFAPNVLIFLDQEEGGRLTDQQAAYLFAWIDAVRAAGYRAGVYCSGITVKDESGPISTAQDIAQREYERAKKSSGNNRMSKLAIWVANDQCPPSPGCTVNKPGMKAAFPLTPAVYSPVWQYAQSPRRREFTGQCPQNYAQDENCYAPGLPRGEDSFIDLNVADSPDPSETQQ
jgi:hypothetical protein